MRRMKWGIALATFLITGGAGAAERHVVDGKFSVVPPPRWLLSELDQSKMKEIGRKIGVKQVARAAAPLAVFLSMFPVQNFQSNLNIREVPQVLEPTEDNLSKIRRKLSQGMGAFRPTVNRGLIDTVDGKRVLRIEYSVKLMGTSVHAVQVAYPGRGATFISTYTTHEDAWKRQLPEIETSIRSFRNREPWYAWFLARKWLLYGVIGAAVAVILALLLRRRA